MGDALSNALSDVLHEAKNMSSLDFENTKNVVIEIISTHPFQNKPEHDVKYLERFPTYISAIRVAEAAGLTNFPGSVQEQYLRHKFSIETDEPSEVEYFENGDIKRAVFSKNGQLKAIFEYHPSGVIKSESHYESGREVDHFLPGKKLIIGEKYTNFNTPQVIEYYENVEDENGNPRKKKDIYYVNGYTSKEIEYHENGQVKSETLYKKNKTNSINKIVGYKAFDQQGNRK